MAPDGEQQHFDVLREKQCPMLNFGRFQRPESWARESVVERSWQVGAC